MGDGLESLGQKIVPTWLDEDDAFTLYDFLLDNRDTHDASKSFHSPCIGTGFHMITDRCLSLPLNDT